MELYPRHPPCLEEETECPLEAGDTADTLILSPSTAA